MRYSDFMTMRDIGKLFGKTSHMIGRTLKQLGLRTAKGKPSRQAFEGGLCDRRWTRDLQNYCWAWHGEMTIRLLQEHFGSMDRENIGLAWDSQPLKVDERHYWENKNEQSL